MACRCAALLVATFVGFGVQPAAAADGYEVRVAYDAFESCPSPDQFLMQLHARVPQAVLAPVDVAHLSVVARPQGRRATVRVLLAEDDARDARYIEDDGCVQAVEAAIVVVALAADAHALEWREIAPQQVEVAKPAVGAELQVPRVRRPRYSPPINPVEYPDPPFSDPAPPRLGARAGAVYGAASGFGPAVSTLGVAFGELLDESRQYRVRVSVLYANMGTEPSFGYEVRFSFVGGRVEGCYSPLPAGLLPLCMSAEAGSVMASGSPGVDPLRTKHIATEWAAIGPLARLEASPVPRLSAEVEVGVSFPLIRHRFVFRDPERTVHEFPVAAWHMGAGIGVYLD